LQIGLWFYKVIGCLIFIVYAPVVVINVDVFDLWSVAQQEVLRVVDVQFIVFCQSKNYCSSTLPGKKR